ncbi:flagellar biosynthesis anti-sigma factor FlgM [Halomonas sp. YLGW01]|uniref:flagellar biosynthesis anti-sigma factor FlgM n=1 Tax=Halomonas sp. YLGW01 TaxID=2773308 RepID=UPI0017837281|nr:flagellar biosynthesis anti-sigma factor FlgM [Halomonas sp. YLGW01]
MKISSSNPLNRPQAATQGQEKDATPAQPGNAKGGGPATVTHLNQSAGDASQDIDSARVDEVRQAISEGRLDIRADKIADGLIKDVENMMVEPSR